MSKYCPVFNWAKFKYPKSDARPVMVPAGNGCEMCDGKGNESVFIGHSEEAKQEPGWRNGWVIQICACEGKLPESL